MSRPKTLKDMSSTTFSQALALGHTHSGWLDGLTTDPSSRDRALASHSVAPAKVKGLQTSATCGPLFGGSSPSEGLQCALGSKLRARMDVNGSLEYALTWKQWDIDAGPPICALRASERPTAASGSTGWPTPTERDVKGPTGQESNLAQHAKGHERKILAETAGWCTPAARDWKDTPGMELEATNPDGSKRERVDHLGRQAALATLQPWQTPGAMDGGASSRSGDRIGELLLGGQMRSVMGWPPPMAGSPATERYNEAGNTTIVSGTTTPSSSATRPASDAASSRGALNPAHSRWLMGLPVHWDLLAPRKK